jgi:hypothetical protein
VLVSDITAFEMPAVSIGNSCAIAGASGTIAANAAQRIGCFSLQVIALGPAMESTGEHLAEFWGDG